MKFKLVGAENYAARTVRIQNTFPLKGRDKIVGTLLFGQHVIIGKDTEIGTLGIYFPIETVLNRDFISKNNLFKSSDLNKDKTKQGFFDHSRRVKCISLGGFRSEGFFIPIESLTADPVEEGLVFDTVDGVTLCEKFIRKDDNPTTTSMGKKAKKAQKKLKKFNRMVENQFRFHSDTQQLGYNLFKLTPESIIGISTKIHGTSWIVSNVLTKRPLTLLEKVAGFFGSSIKDTSYDHIAASRQVVKNKFINTEVGSGFYNFDLWSDIKDKIKHSIPKGFTCYGEAFGYLPTGKMIQKGYHYGCEPGSYDTIVYRVTFTNEDGLVFELSESQILDFCNTYKLRAKDMLFYGKAKDCFPEIPVDENWNDAFYNRLRFSFNLEKMCPHNNNEVPFEGVVVRLDEGNSFTAFKCKSFLFNKRESKAHDEGEVDIETEQSLGETNETLD